MNARRNAPAGGAARGEARYQNEQAKFTKKSRPAYAAQFAPDSNGFAVLCVGWPPARPPARNVLALPPDTAPTAINWRCLRGAHVFATPPPGAHAPRDILRELGAELAAAGVASLTIFDGVEFVADWWCAGRPRVHS